MTASRLHGVEVPAAAGRPLVSPTVDARSRSPALAVRIGLAGVAVVSAAVGWVLFGDTDPDLWWGSFWPVRELMAPAIAFSFAEPLWIANGCLEPTTSGPRPATRPAEAAPSATAVRSPSVSLALHRGATTTATQR